MNHIAEFKKKHTKKSIEKELKMITQPTTPAPHRQQTAVKKAL